MRTEFTVQAEEAAPLGLRQVPHRLVGTIEPGMEYGPSTVVMIGEVVFMGEVILAETEAPCVGVEEPASEVEMIGHPWQFMA